MPGPADEINCRVQRKSPLDLVAGGSRMTGVDYPRDEVVERNDLSDEHDRQRVRAN
jgi:hypothetical protein